MKFFNTLTAVLLTLPLAIVAEEKPNVIIIYGDDVGYGDLGAYGAELIPTPHLDKLAKESLRFTDGHCSAATCTPSRFSMLTGVHGFRHNVRILAPNAPMVIKPKMFTLPRLFKKAGYKTAVIGKWHLGIGDGKNRVDWNGEVKPGPLELGFDYSFLLPSTNDRVPCVYLENYRVRDLDPKDPLYVGKKPPKGFRGTIYPDARKDPAAMSYYKSTHGHNNSVINGIGRIGYMWGGKSALWNDETIALEFSKQARKYISAQKKGEPFFLYWAASDIHVPRAPNKMFHGKSQHSLRGDAMVQLDWCVGEITKVLEERGLAENTIVIFSSDNGPVYDDGYEDGTTVKKSEKESDHGHDGSGPYRGGKYQIYEGGTRVPFIVRWPRKIKPGVSAAMVSQIDFMASFSDLLGVALSDDQGMDSRDILTTLLGEDQKGTEVLIQEAKGLAIRKGQWKFIAPSKGQEKNKGQLYNLATDVGERKNLIKKEPKRAESMQILLNQLVTTKKGVRLELNDSK